MTTPTDQTLLILSGMGVPLYSGRGLQFVLTAISQDGQLERDINGELVDMTLLQFERYQIEITCTDQQSPALDGIWKGQKLTITSPIELSYATGKSGSPGRGVATGSSRTSGSFTFYRPIFEAMVTDFSTQGDEWGHTYNWKLTAEEWEPFGS